MVHWLACTAMNKTGPLPTCNSYMGFTKERERQCRVRVCVWVSSELSAVRQAATDLYQCNFRPFHYMEQAYWICSVNACATDLPGNDQASHRRACVTLLQASLSGIINLPLTRMPENEAGLVCAYDTHRHTNIHTHTHARIDTLMTRHTHTGHIHIHTHRHPHPTHQHTLTDAHALANLYSLWRIRTSTLNFECSQRQIQAVHTYKLPHRVNTVDIHRYTQCRHAIHSEYSWYDFILYLHCRLWVSPIWRKRRSSWSSTILLSGSAPFRTLHGSFLLESYYLFLGTLQWSSSTLLFF